MSREFESEPLSSADPRRWARAFDARTRSLRPASEPLQAYLSAMPEDMRRRVLVDRRIREVHEQFRRIVDPFILDHTNSVYLMRSKAVDQACDLVVYVDNSLCAAELNARRELIRLKYREEFGVVVDVFEIRISRGVYKDKHPFRDEAPTSASAADPAAGWDCPLDESDEERIERLVGQLPEGRVRDSFEKAIAAQIRRSKRKL